MAKYKRKIVQRSVGNTVTTKSWFGSHEEMVVEPEELEPSDELYLAHLHHSEVICKDDKGAYTTYKNRLDNGLADPNRYSKR